MNDKFLFHPDENRDWFYLNQCLKLAKKAKKKAEVPVGAMVVHSQTGQVLSRAFNLKEKLNSPLAHAETLAIHKACRRLGQWRLVGYSLYSSLEPCIMCCGVILQSRLDRVIYSAKDTKGGGQSLLGLFDQQEFNHKLAWSQGILERESALLIKGFFREKRKNRDRNDEKPLEPESI